MPGFAFRHFDSAVASRVACFLAHNERRQNQTTVSQYITGLGLGTEFFCQLPLLRLLCCLLALQKRQRPAPRSNMSHNVSNEEMSLVAFVPKESDWWFGVEWNSECRERENV